jgi:hypothetical protein
MPTDEEVFDSAREVNSTFKETVAGVQEQLWSEEWRVEGGYGDFPDECPDGYSFRMTRYLPVAEGWRFGAEPARLRDDLAAWMEDNGFTDVTGLSYTDDVDTLTLTARNTAGLVDEITVQFHPGEVQDGISLSATSTCTRGDARRLVELTRPGFYSDAFSQWPTPATERPDATPVFGFTEDGQPR